MKKISLKVAVALIIGGMSMNSCIGSYSLFNKYAAWQKDMTSNKFVNAIVGFFLMPIVGGVTLFIDSVVLNTIEFWSGDNPMAVGKTRQIVGQDGKAYAVTTLKNGYEVKAANGETTLLTYDKASDAWSVSQNGVTRELFRFNADGQTISVSTADGQRRDFSLNETGLYEAQMAAGGGQFFAAR